MDFTKTIIPLALMASESIAHEAEGLYGEAVLEGLPFSGFMYIKSRDFTC